MESEFSEEVLESMTTIPPFAELDEAPSEEELVSALQIEKRQSWRQDRHST